MGISERIKLNQRDMIVGVDASNLRGGGGTTHLVEVLRASQPHEHGFDQVIVWGGESTLKQMEDRPWLCKMHDPLLDRTLPLRLYWQRIMLDRLVRQERCDVLFVPGGSYSGSSRPFVTMCQNMLPFDWSETRRYGISWYTLKFLLVRWSQLTTFRQADGLIFLTKYAQTAISPFLNGTTGRIALIPHGVDERFRKKPKLQRPISSYSAESPFRLLYVSPVAPYKHQWHVMEAVHKLRQMGLPLVLELVGPSYHSVKRFVKALAKWDPNGEWIQYRGEIPFIHLHEIYQEAELFVYASSCENMPNILLEAMAAGLPIASSNRGPMPEMLDKAAVYFNPEHPVEIANAIKTLVDDPHLREEKSWASYEAAKAYTWRRCAQETFDFLAQVAQRASA